MKSRYKILILVGLPLYGILPFNFVDNGIIFFLNPIPIIIMSFMNVPFFYDKNMFQFEWLIHPILNIISNLIFWIPAGIILIRYLEKRENRRRIRK